MKFNSKKEENTVKEILAQGVKSEFWNLIQKALIESREHIQEQLDNQNLQTLPADQYKFTVELFQSKKRFIDSLLETPGNIIKWIGSESYQESRNFDPYSKD